MLSQSCRWKWKGTSTRDFFNLSKKNLPHGCFHNIVTFCKSFLGKNKGKKQQHYKKVKHMLTLLTLLSVNAKSTVLLKVLSLTKVQVHNFPLLYFPKWLYLVYRQLAMSPRHVKRSVIYKGQCFCLFDIQQWSVLS